MFQDKLIAMQACSAACKYAEQFSDLQAAWNACERGDWMLWLLGRVDTSEPWSDARKPLLAAALDCAETSKHLWKPATIAGVATLRKWIAGETSLTEAKQAREDLYAAAAAAATAAAYAAYAATATAAAATDATDAAYAATATATATATAAATAARAKILKNCADIVRKNFPVAPEL
jgi:hypothetical protein